METEDRNMTPHAAPSVPETPVRLKHTESQFCWCEPVTEWEDDGQEIVVHREVTWN
jgi:hypothetical protein